MGSNQSLNDVHLDAVEPPVEVISSKYISSLPTTVMHLKFHCLKRPGSVDIVDINSSDTEKLFQITVGEGGDKVVADAEGNAGELLHFLERQLARSLLLRAQQAWPGNHTRRIQRASLFARPLTPALFA